MDLAKKYDPIIGWVKNHAGVNLFRVCPELFSEVFNLDPNHVVHENIDIDDLQARYDAQRIYLRIGPLWEHATKISTLPVITASTPEPLLRRHFNLRAQALYFSLCKILGIDEVDQIPGSIVLMMAQTLQFGMSTILHFATFLAKEIHNGLVGIVKGKVNKPFYWYSLLMYVCLYKGSTFFSKGMELETTRDGEKNLVQLWSVDMTLEATNSNYVRFDRCFASNLRLLLKGDSP